MSNTEIIKRLFEPKYKKDISIWKQYLKTINNNEILWYPSAGDDFRLFYHIQKNGINNLFSALPIICYSDRIFYDFSEGDTIVNHIDTERTQNVNIRIKQVYDIQFNRMPENADFVHYPDIEILNRFLKTPRVDLNENNYSNDDNSEGSIEKFLKPKSREKIWNIIKSKGYELDELLKPEHKIKLINFTLTTPDNETIEDQYVLYFYWDNITFFELVVNTCNLPVKYIMSNRNCMDEESIKTIWTYLFKKKSISHIICDEGLFMRNIQRNLKELNAYNTDINRGYHWGGDDYVKVFKISR